MKHMKPWFLIEGDYEMAERKKASKNEFMAMARKMGLSVKEMQEMLGFPTLDKEGVKKHAKGGMLTPVAKKKMRGGGMAKMAKKKMMRGGVAKKK
jgi:hypothetical protein